MSEQELSPTIAPTPPLAPVLLLAFNRPDLFCRVIQAMEDSGPREVFVAIDGPREGNLEDQEDCRRVRELAESIRGSSKMHFKIEPKNLGCGEAVRSAIDWALAQVPEIIILEDDCLPSPSFFAYCDELLARYRDDWRVMQIAGSNWGANSARFSGYSYGFTSFAAIWGWATWRRAWNLYDFQLDSWPRLKASRQHHGMALSSRFRRLLERDWDIVLAGNGTWDHQWQYSVLRNHGLSICPAENLVVNIGFGPKGTQLTSHDRVFSNLPLAELPGILRHPPEVLRNASVESVFERIYWQKLGWPARTFRRFIKQPRLNAWVRYIWHAMSSRPT